MATHQTQHVRPAVATGVDVRAFPEPGGEYRPRGGGPEGDAPVTVVGTARHTETHQRLVVWLRGDGSLACAPVAAFWRRFYTEPAETPATATATPPAGEGEAETPAGKHLDLREGSGY